MDINCNECTTFKGYRSHFRVNLKKRSVLLKAKSDQIQWWFQTKTKCKVLASCDFFANIHHFLKTNFSDSRDRKNVCQIKIRYRTFSTRPQ